MMKHLTAKVDCYTPMDNEELHGSKSFNGQFWVKKHPYTNVDFFQF
jgi:hypothetical protein